MAKRPSDWEKEQRIKDKERAARMRFGVFNWEAQSRYRTQDAIKVFKSEASASTWRDENARDEDNWVVRSFLTENPRVNGDVVDASGRFAERKAERSRQARGKVEATLESAADLMAADPGFQQAARKRQAERKMSEHAAGAQLFQPKDRVVYAPTPEDIRNDDIAIPSNWVGTIVEHTWYDESEREDPEMAHYYTVRWRTPEGRTHEGFYDQDHLAAYSAKRRNPEVGAASVGSPSAVGFVKELFAEMIERAPTSAFVEPVRLVVDDATALQGRVGIEAGGRACACASEGTVFISRALLTSSPERIKGVLAHELGHVHLLQHGEENHSEREADEVAWELFGVSVGYDDEDVQTSGHGKRPRPARLDRRQNPGPAHDHAGCVVRSNPSATAALSELADTDADSFEEHYGDDPESLRQSGEVRHGRKVVWVGSPGKMVEIDRNFVAPIQGNQFDPAKLAAVAEAVREQSAPTESGKPVLYVGYGTVQFVTQSDIDEAGQYEDDEWPLDRELTEDDIGKLFYTIRDGNHRTFGALIGGETKVWMNLDANQFQDVEAWRRRKKEPLPEYLAKNRSHLKLMKLLDEKLRND